MERDRVKTDSGIDEKQVSAKLAKRFNKMRTDKKKEKISAKQLYESIRRINIDEKNNIVRDEVVKKLVYDETNKPEEEKGFGKNVANFLNGNFSLDQPKAETRKVVNKVDGNVENVTSALFGRPQNNNKLVEEVVTFPDSKKDPFSNSKIVD